MSENVHFETWDVHVYTSSREHDVVSRDFQFPHSKLEKEANDAPAVKVEFIDLKYKNGVELIFED